MTPNWKALSPQEVCDLLDFWTNAPWPMQADDTSAYAAQLGWTTEKDSEDGEEMMFFVNTNSNLTTPEVDVIDMPSGEIAFISFYASDIIRGDISEESKNFLNDQFLLYVKEAETRWGAATNSGSNENGTHAEWDYGKDKGRITIFKNVRSLTAICYTPQYAEVMRDLGE